MQYPFNPNIERYEREMSKVRLRPDVVTFNPRQSDKACADLMSVVMRDGRPDVLVGIRTGGLVVADAMSRAAGGRLAVLALTCHRPSSRKKDNAGYLRRMIDKLPERVLDELRVIEHAWLTRDAWWNNRSRIVLDSDELSMIDSWLSRAGAQPDLVVVDDTVDSGATLDLVLRAVRQRAKPGTRIRSAAITVTTAQPLVRPDYALLDRTLCRFPWSRRAID